MTARAVSISTTNDPDYRARLEMPDAYGRVALSLEKRNHQFNVWVTLDRKWVEMPAGKTLEDEE